jgi:hypothetical protein
MAGWRSIFSGIFRRQQNDEKCNQTHTLQRSRIGPDLTFAMAYFIVKRSV